MPRRGALKLKVQLYCGEERAFGPGRADVLEAIAREGSISAAGRSLGMSYRFTWLLVDSMNRSFREKLVETASGGQRGGGAGLTEAGHRALAAYRAIETRMAAAAQGPELDTLEAMLREVALPVGG